jgi:hypothetical protein
MGDVFAQQALERLESSAAFNQVGDVYLGADEVADPSLVVVEGGYQNDIEERCAVSPTRQIETCG